MRNVRSHHQRRALVAVGHLWLIVSILALAAVAIIDVDGDPMTSNVTSVASFTDRFAVEAAAVEPSVETGTSIRPSRDRPQPIFKYLGVRSLWARCARSIRGP
jgi:hypothetical protein